MDNFLHIADTGAPIVLYVDTEIREAYKDTWAKYTNNIVLRDVDYASSWTYKVCSLYKDNLPASRNQVKDSFLFLCLMNMKIEFVVSAVNENPFNTNHFAWIDFNLAHIFKDKWQTAQWMHYLTTCYWAPKFIANPGCWDKGQGQESIVDNINWRFCGGFMIGDGESFNELFDLYLEHFTPFMHKYRHITWEVNFWAWLEVNARWNITWYKADHDDSIVRVPSRLLAVKLHGRISDSTAREQSSLGRISDSTAREQSSLATKYIPLTDQLPKKPGFFPMSASFINLECKGKKGETENTRFPVLNVRYINYQLDPQGRYIIHHPQGHLETLNLRCYLSDDLETVTSSEFMWEGMMQLKEYDTSIKGLEDVRLYNDNGALKYVATNRSYNPAQKIRIMTGDYNDSMAMFENGSILEPPTDTNCEKNWIPLGENYVPPNPLLSDIASQEHSSAKGIEDSRLTNKLKESAQYFIYRWSPFEVGVIEHGQLKIIKSLPSKLPRIRGSTVPVPLKYKDESNKEGAGGNVVPLEYICVVHYCEHGPQGLLEYYHILVKLNAAFEPVQWSVPFYFNKIGIQYCIGFTIADSATSSPLKQSAHIPLKQSATSPLKNKNAYFWFSEHDSNPGLIIIADGRS
jgi:hypothetical protein